MTGDSVIDLVAVQTRLAADGLLPSDTVSAFCVGSTARGWATPASDYDVYIVTGTQFRTRDSVDLTVPLQPAVVPVVVTYVDQRRWEVKYWTDGQVDQMLAKATLERFEADRGGGALTYMEELFLERVLTCIPLMGADWVEARRDDVRAGAYREFVVSRSLGDADDAAEDALGQLAAEDPYSAVLSAHRAMRHTVDALLDGIGCYGTVTPKWRSRRMREAVPDGLGFEEYWAMETMADLDRRDPAPWVRAIVTWCRETALEIEL